MDVGDRAAQRLDFGSPERVGTAISFDQGQQEKRQAIVNEGATNRLLRLVFQKLLVLRTNKDRNKRVVLCFVRVLDTQFVVSVREFLWGALCKYFCMNKSGTVALAHEHQRQCIQQFKIPAPPRTKRVTACTVWWMRSDKTQKNEMNLRRETLGRQRIVSGASDASVPRCRSMLSGSSAPAPVVEAASISHASGHRAASRRSREPPVSRRCQRSPSTLIKQCEQCKQEKRSYPPA